MDITGDCKRSWLVNKYNPCWRKRSVSPLQEEGGGAVPPQGINEEKRRKRSWKAIIIIKPHIIKQPSVDHYGYGADCKSAAHREPS